MVVPALSDFSLLSNISETSAEKWIMPIGENAYGQLTVS
jgi:hypothetical protein